MVVNLSLSCQGDFQVTPPTLNLEVRLSTTWGLVGSKVNPPAQSSKVYLCLANSWSDSPSDCLTFFHIGKLVMTPSLLSIEFNFHLSIIHHCFNFLSRLLVLNMSGSVLITLKWSTGLQRAFLSCSSSILYISQLLWMGGFSFHFGSPIHNHHSSFNFLSFSSFFN